MICFVCCIHLCIMCIASCHHAIMSFLFLTQLNKPYGSSIHLNRGNSHGDSLYNISSRYLESYSKYSNYLDLPQTHLQIFPMPLLSRFLTSNFARKFFRHFSELHQKSEHFWTFLLSSPSSNPFELNSNEFDFKSFNHGLSIFLGTSIFLRVRENYPHAQIFPLTSLSFLSFLYSVLLFISEREPTQPGLWPLLSPPGPTQPAS